jgi:Tfp pilus assembly protein FimV
MMANQELVAHRIGARISHRVRHCVASDPAPRKLSSSSARGALAPILRATRMRVEFAPRFKRSAPKVARRHADIPAEAIASLVAPAFT